MLVNSSQRSFSLEIRESHIAPPHLQPSSGAFTSPPQPKCTSEYTCPSCPNVYKRKDHLKRHMRNSHNDADYPCPLCPHTFKDEKTLSSHISELHGSADLFVCPICRTEFGLYATFLNHYESHLMAELKIFKCSECNSKFKRLEHMKRHFNSRHSELKIACEICSKKFKRKDHLHRHATVMHGCGRRPGPEPYLCRDGGS